jgi:hypothetical protein
MQLTKGDPDRLLATVQHLLSADSSRSAAAGAN